MGGISLDAFRAMAAGTYNLGSVVVNTDKVTHEQTLAKVNNSQGSRKITVIPPNKNAETRQMLVTLMAADLRKAFGEGSEGVKAFVEELKRTLLGDNAQKDLERAGDLSKAFNLFDSFKTRKLIERKVSLDVQNAQKELVLTKRRINDEVKLKSARSELDAVINKISGEVENEVAAAKTKLEEVARKLFDDGGDITPSLQKALDDAKAEMKQAVDKADLWKQIKEHPKSWKEAETDVEPQNGLDAWKKTVIAQLRQKQDEVETEDSRAQAWQAIKQKYPQVDEAQGDEQPKVGFWKGKYTDELKKAEEGVSAAKSKVELKKQYFDPKANAYQEKKTAVGNEYSRLAGKFSKGDGAPEKLTPESFDSKVFKQSCRNVGVKISEKNFIRIFNERKEAVIQTAIAKMEASGGTLLPGKAIMLAVQDLRAAEHAAEKRGGPASLDATDKALIDILVKAQDGKDVMRMLDQNPELKAGVGHELLGAIRNFLYEPNTEMSLELSIPLSANGKKREWLTILQNADNRISVGYKGHTFALQASAADLNRNILATKMVANFQTSIYDEFNCENSVELKNAHQNWDGKLSSDFPRFDQKKIVAQIDEMLVKLRECNNRNPDFYGAAPHYGNKMPTLDIEGSRTARFLNLPFSFCDTGRTKTFFRNYVNNEVRKANEFKGGKWDTFKAKGWGMLCKIGAWACRVPLVAGSGEGGGSAGNTVFERAARYLHQLRQFALNANYLFSHFDKDTRDMPEAEWMKLSQSACDEFGRITQFVLHPKFGANKYPPQHLLHMIRVGMAEHLTAFQESSEQHNQLDKLFKCFADGPCFNGCLTNIAEFINDNLPGVQADVSTICEGGGARPARRTMERPVAQPVVSDEDAALLKAFEEKKAKGELVIHPSLEKNLHAPKREGLLGYLGKELNALNSTFNPPNAQERKIFKWNDVKAFLQERLKKVDADAVEKAVTEGRRKAVFNFLSQSKDWNERVIGKVRFPRGHIGFGQKAIAKFTVMNAEARKTYLGQMERGAERGNWDAKWMMKYFDPETITLKKDLIEADYQAELTAYNKLVDDVLADVEAMEKADEAKKGTRTGAETQVQPEEKKEGGEEVVDEAKKAEQEAYGKLRSDISAGLRPYLKTDAVKGQIEKVAKEAKLSLGFVDEKFVYHAPVGLDDEGFWDQAEKLLKASHYITEDGNLDFPSESQVLDMISPSLEPVMGEDELLKDFKERKTEKKPAIDPRTDADLHGRDDAAFEISRFVMNEIKAAYREANPPGTNPRDLKIFSWEQDIRPFLEARFEQIDKKMQNEAVQKAHQKLVARPAEVRAEILAKSNELALTHGFRTEGREFLVGLLAKDKKARQAAIRALRNGNSPLLPWVELFLNSGKSNLADDYDLGLVAKPWLDAYLKANPFGGRRGDMLKELKDTKSKLLPFVANFIDVETGKFKPDFMEANGRKPSEAKLDARYAELFGEARIKYLDDKLDEFIGKLEAEIGASVKEAESLTKADYLQSQLDEAKEGGALWLFCDADTINAVKKDDQGLKERLKTQEVENFMGMDGYAKVRCSGPEYMKVIERVLEDNGYIKKDDTPEFVQGIKRVKPIFVKEGQDGSEQLTMLRPVGSSNRQEEVIYDPNVHGTEFTMSAGQTEEGFPILRTLDGRFEISSNAVAEGTEDKHIASPDGDAEYKKGDLYIKD